MTTKEFLSRAYKLEKEIRYKTRLLDGLKSRSACSSPVFSDMPKEPHNPKSLVEYYALRIVEVEHEIMDLQEELQKARKEIAEAIRTVDNTELETLLEMRYLGYLEWNEISARFGYVSNYVFRRHRNALRKVKIG